MERNQDRAPAMRELFIEELAEVKGGGPDYLDTVRDLIRELFLTTQACGEEIPSPFC